MATPSTPAPTVEPQARPTNVVAALAAITAELGPIEKLTPAQRRQRGMMTGGDDERGIKYAYRGVDQIAAELQPLLGEYGVAIVPRVASHDVTDIEVGGKPWTSHTVLVHWSIYGPGGIGDMIEATTIGEGRDNSDKGVNKATTAAYKNLLLRMFSIGDPSEDPDVERHETSAAAVAANEHTIEAVRVFERLRALSGNTAVVAALKKLGEQHPDRDFRETSLRDPAWRREVEEAVEIATRQPQAEAGEVQGNLEYGDEPEGLGDALGEALS